MRFAIFLLLAGCRWNFDPFGSEPSDGPPPDRPPFVTDVVPPDSPLPSGLVVWYPMDEAMAVNAADVVTGVVGICTGNECPMATTGRHGGGFLFDGLDDCIQVPDVGQFGQAKITIAIWIDLAVLDNCSAVAKRVDVGGNPLDTWQLETTTGDDVYFTSNHGGTGNSRIVATNALTTGTFHHLAATFDGTTRLLYVDGMVKASATAPALFYDTHSAWIGCDDNGTTLALHFNGILDDFQVYNRALDASEIAALANM